MGAAVGDPYREQSTFAPGSVLKDRFRVLRFLARGGAGEVYEAFDTELRCPVAIKLVRPEVATNERAVDRFRREIALARQVTHPNVSRIFDVFRVELPSTHSGQRPVNTLFLSMELLVGESLAARLHRLGPLSQTQALPLVIDIIEGLKAAHRAGVIHRDLKSANIMLARNGDEVRAVIMDFGLAQDRARDPDDPNPLTNSGVVVGTPNYMSPEQLTGGEITPAVDQYSLGIVLFEMLTGERPFRGENEVSTAVKRLTEPPPSPRAIVPELDVHWERTVLRMLDVEPGQRFARLDDILHTLVGTTMPVALPGGGAVRRPVRPSVLFTAGGVVLVALALSQAGPELSKRLFTAESLTQSLIADRGAAPLTIGTIQPDVVPQAYRWMTTAITGILAHALHGDGIDVSWVPSSDLSDAADPPSQRAALHAPLYVGGSYLLDPALELITLELTFVDDSIESEIWVQGSAHQLVEVATEAAARIRSAAGLSSSLNTQRPDPSALLLRVAARELNSGRNLAGLRLLEQGRNADPPSGALLAELSYVLLQAGNRDAALQAARRAMATDASDRRGQLSAQAAVAWAAGDLMGAADYYAELQRSYSDDPAIKLRRAAVLIELREADEALAVLDEIPSEDRNQNMIAWTLRARAYNQREAASEALNSATRAIDIGRNSGADIPLGEALLQAGRAHLLQQDLNPAKRYLVEADRLLQRSGGTFIRVRVLETLIELEQGRSALSAVADLQQRLADLRTSTRD